jgi:hypothetical protein
MNLNLTFNNTANCAAAAPFFKAAIEPDATTFAIPWDMLNVAKTTEGVIGITQVSNDPEEFIINGDVTDTTISSLISEVKQDLGSGYFHVVSTAGLSLHDVCEHVDPVFVPNLGLHNVSSITSVNGQEADPLSSAGQWARIRVASTYRPLLSSFAYYDSLVIKSKPEVYIMDSGVDWNHDEFAGLDHDDFFLVSTCSDYTDNSGHGTLVASCIAGKNVGIAKDIKLRSVKIADQHTFTTSMLDFNNAIQAIIDEVTTNPNVTRVVNMSFAMPLNNFFNSRVQAMLDAGITVVAAAGNSGIDIATLSPAGMAGVITVASVDKYDIPSGFNDIAPSNTGLITNTGKELTIFAPGENVVAADANSSSGYLLTSGTSLSAGYVSGTIAQIAALYEDVVPNPMLTQKMLDVSTKDAILFDNTAFTTTENCLIHIVGMQDVQVAALSLYLGQLPNINNNLQLDTNVCLNLAVYNQLSPDSATTYELSFESPEIENSYSQFFDIDSNGVFTITTPDVALPEGDIIVMVRFKVKATHDVVSIESPWIFFFNTDPSAEESVKQTDITRALSETNSTSVFLATAPLK